MKKLFTKLIPSSKITTSISGNFTTQFTTRSSSISKSPIQNLKPYKTHQFYKNPSQNYSTRIPYYVESTPYYVGITPSYPSDHSKIEKNRSLIQEAVTAAKAAKLPEEMLEAFKKDKFDKGDIGLACLNIGLQLAQEGEDYQKIISFANKSLVFLENVEKNNCCLPVAMTLLLLGFTNCSLRKFNDALGFLNRANNILAKLEYDCKYEYGVKSVKTVLNALYMELAYVEARMGRGKEAVDYLRKSLRVKKFLMRVDSREFANANRDFANANRDFAEACVASKNYKEGLLYCLKALEIHWELPRLGWKEQSLEIGHDKRILGVIYAWMEEYEKALEAFKMAQDFLYDIRSVIDVANVYIALGRYEAAMNTLKEHGKKVEEDSENPLILMTMGKALVHQENFVDAKGCFVIACSVLDKEEKAKPLDVANAYIKIADEYESMKDFETAISLFMRALALLEKLPEEQHLEGGVLTGKVTQAIGSLFMLTGKVTQAIPYLERAPEIVKESYGSKHFGVGCIYNKLGRAYLELERPKLMAEILSVAKDILDCSRGPRHNKSIDTCQNL